MKPPKVIISYSHDSLQHSKRVLAFAQALRKDGVDVELDQFHQDEIIDWPRWCNEHTSREHSDFVICVCTAEFNRRIEGKVPPERGKGVHWEGSLLDDEIYDAKGNRRILAALFDDAPESSIPRFLRGWTFCRLHAFDLKEDPGYEHLLRIFTGQARVVKNPVGPVPFLPPTSGRQPGVQDAEELSPAPETHQNNLPPSIQGIVAFHQHRSALGPEWWNTLFSAEKRPKRVIMMGQSMTGTFSEENAITFRKWCVNGTKMQILFLSPDCRVSNQLLDISRQIAYSTDHVLQLATKIKKSIENLEARLIFKLPNESSKPLVRFATRDLPFSLMAVDDLMTVTFYGTEPEGNRSPTLIVKGEQTNAFKTYLNEFECLWKEHSNVCAYRDPLLMHLSHDWQALSRLRTGVPPAPRQAILFPTYRCQVVCDYCMYAHNKDRIKSEMDVKTFENMVAELLTAGVLEFELSGGGEPLCHREFDSIIGVLKNAASSFPNVRFGLLTNGHYLARYDNKQLVHTFNNYIRVSRYQASLRDGRRWRESIKRLIKAKVDSGAGTEIGLKYLLTKSTHPDMLQAIEDDLRDSDLRKADHFRFRSSRDFPENDIAEVEQKIWRILKAERDIDCEHRVSLALGKTRYSTNFKCWISPMHVVVDPMFDVFLCCNFLHNEGAKRLGNLVNDSFSSLWAHPRHLAARQKLHRENCDRCYYSNCRFAELQDHIERLMFVTGQNISETEPCS
jgi:sulfatase maturation enzyme AslB (radical SAM superfamily)